MEHQTRQLLRILADDLTDDLLEELSSGEVLETDLRRRMPRSRQTIGRRLEELEAWGIVASQERTTPGPGRPTRGWELSGAAVRRFGNTADAFALALMDARAE